MELHQQPVPEANDKLQFSPVSQFAFGFVYGMTHNASYGAIFAFASTCYYSVSCISKFLTAL